MCSVWASMVVPSVSYRVKKRSLLIAAFLADFQKATLEIGPFCFFERSQYILPTWVKRMHVTVSTFLHEKTCLLINMVKERVFVQSIE